MTDAWRLAMEIAAELHVTPWEALLMEVRRSAARALWVDEQLATVVAMHGAVDEPETLMSQGKTGQKLRSREGAPVQAVARWLAESRAERSHLARVSKAAIDAGVAERLVRQVGLESRLVAEALVKALDVLELGHDDRLRALEAAHKQLTSVPDEAGIA